MPTDAENDFINFNSNGGSFNWNVIEASQTDADSPVNEILTEGIRQNLLTLMEWLGKDYTSSAAPNHDHDGKNSSLINDGTLASIIGDHENILVFYADSGSMISIDQRVYTNFTNTSWETRIRINVNKRGKYKCLLRVSANERAYHKMTVNGALVKTIGDSQASDYTWKFNSGELLVDDDVKIESKSSGGQGYNIIEFKMYSAPALELRVGTRRDEEVYS